ncbi:hypothetical protein COT72_00235 [archaeon CG10_big_fil_rev_8_21_14_0_10_43_11]|nr:MAG: hypothetical protein COT72_00235 [archaeon CG10_big_fil_rev_8_21_14_0_10_43_11]
MSNPLLQKKYFLILTGIGIGIILSLSTIIISTIYLENMTQPESKVGAIAPVKQNADITANAGIACRANGGLECAEECTTYILPSGNTTTNQSEAPYGQNIGCLETGNIYCCLN